MSWTLEWGPVVYGDALHIPWRTAGKLCAAVIRFAETNRGPVRRVSPHDPRWLKLVVPGAVALMYADPKTGVLLVPARSPAGSPGRPVMRRSRRTAPDRPRRRYPDLAGPCNSPPLKVFHGDNRITVDPAILGGKLCIRGMRLSVQRLLEVLAEHPSLEDLSRRAVRWRASHAPA